MPLLPHTAISLQHILPNLRVFIATQPIQPVLLQASPPSMDDDDDAAASPMHRGDSEAGRR